MKKRNITYVVEIGRHKGSYKRVRVSSTLSRALLLYHGYNIGNGYKKRLRLIWETKHLGTTPQLNTWLPDSITLLTYAS